MILAELASSDISLDKLIDGGMTTAIAYAAIQIGKGVLAITKFLERMGDKWDEEKAHREAEAKHWAAVESANEIAIAQRVEFVEMLGAVPRAQA